MRATSMRKVGRRGTESARIRSVVWPQVLRRAQNRCEGCGEPMESVGGLEWAHAFGRPGSGLCLGPLADSAELTLALCRTCHNRMDRGLDTDLRTYLRCLAYGRLSARLQLAEGAYFAPEEAVRNLIRAAEESGLAPEVA